MSLPGNLFSPSKAYRPATPVLIGSQRFVPEGRRFMRFSGQSSFSLAVCACRLLSRAQTFVSVPTHLASVRASFRLVPARTQRRAVSPVVRFAQALSQHPRPFSAVQVSPFVHQKITEKPVASSTKGLTHHSTGPARKAAQAG